MTRVRWLNAIRDRLVWQWTFIRTSRFPLIFSPWRLLAPPRHHLITARTKVMDLSMQQKFFISRRQRLFLDTQTVSGISHYKVIVVLQIHSSMANLWKFFLLWGNNLTNSFIQRKTVATSLKVIKTHFLQFLNDVSFPPQCNRMIMSLCIEIEFLEASLVVCCKVRTWKEGRKYEVCCRIKNFPSTKLLAKRFIWLTEKCFHLESNTFGCCWSWFNSKVFE